MDACHSNAGLVAWLCRHDPGTEQPEQHRPEQQMLVFVVWLCHHDAPMGTTVNSRAPFHAMSQALVTIRLPFKSQ